MIPHIETVQDALMRCNLLWKHLHKTGSEDKYQAHIDVLGYKSSNACPACDFAQANAIREEYYICLHCPVTEWRKSTEKKLAKTGYMRVPPCRDKKSPYKAWETAKTDAERSETAFNVLNLIRDSLSNH